MKTEIYTNNDLYGSSLILTYFSKTRFPEIGDELRYFVTQAEFYKFVEGKTAGETDKQLKLSLTIDIRKFTSYTKEPLPDKLVDWLVINYNHMLSVIDGHRSLIE